MSVSEIKSYLHQLEEEILSFASLRGLLRSPKHSLFQLRNFRLPTIWQYRIFAAMTVYLLGKPFT